MNSAMVASKPLRSGHCTRSTAVFSIRNPPFSGSIVREDVRRKGAEIARGVVTFFGAAAALDRGHENIEFALLVERFSARNQRYADDDKNRYQCDSASSHCSSHFASGLVPKPIGRVLFGKTD